MILTDKIVDWLILQSLRQDVHSLTGLLLGYENNNQISVLSRSLCIHQSEDLTQHAEDVNNLLPAGMVVIIMAGLSLDQNTQRFLKSRFHGMNQTTHTLWYFAFKSLIFIPQHLRESSSTNANNASVHTALWASWGHISLVWRCTQCPEFQ